MFVCLTYYRTVGEDFKSLLRGHSLLGPGEHVDGPDLRTGPQQLLDQALADEPRPTRHEDVPTLEELGDAGARLEIRHSLSNCTYLHMRIMQISNKILLSKAFEILDNSDS